MRETKKEPCPPILWQKRVGEALRNLPDRSALSRSPLARLSYVEKIASERYNGRLMAKGLALREVLCGCVEGVVSDVANEPTLRRERQYLELVRDGLSCSEASKRLGLSREHVSRTYRKKALQLLTEEFLRRTKHGG
jgi:DNA-binding NarL/FixJ family response regulator